MGSLAYPVTINVKPGPKEEEEEKGWGEEKEQKITGWFIEQNFVGFDYGERSHICGLWA